MIKNDIDGILMIGEKIQDGQRLLINQLMKEKLKRLLLNLGKDKRNLLEIFSMNLI
jgi:hypothetical protein